MNLEHLKEIKARHQAATKGPYYYDGESYIFTKADHHMVAEMRGFGTDLPIDANGEFFAHTWQDMLDLVVEVEKLRKGTGVEFKRAKGTENDGKESGEGDTQ